MSEAQDSIEAFIPTEARAPLGQLSLHDEAFA
jgi:hypothetical protein